MDAVKGAILKDERFLHMPPVGWYRRGEVDLVAGGSNGTIRENKHFLNTVPGLFIV